MRRLLILIVLCLASCKSASPPPPPPEPRSAVRVDVPGVVSVRVPENGGVKVYDPSGGSGVPTVVVPGR